jgi:hypothetical protein
LKTIGSKREPAVEGMVITLDEKSSNPVTVRIAALNGNGISTTNENDLSVVAVVKFDWDRNLPRDLIPDSIKDPADMSVAQLQRLRTQGCFWKPG